ncbi:MAG: ribosome assembly RNA-binding protein YhbY [Gammaproteobacteria bacterium]|nr:ribosome assembly RNA-binding protein YhbY [Gammaproteobacteria bacterium]
MSLLKSQIKYLRSLAHNIKPIVTIGQNGITDNVIAELEGALNFHELVKIKLANDERNDRKEMIRLLCEKTSAEVVQTIGKTATFFRRNNKNPKIAI